MVRVCGHREDAEDALAEALLLAFKASDKLGSDEAFRSWIGTIGRRVCTRMRSHPAIQKTFAYAEERDLMSKDSTAYDLVVLQGCVHDAVSQLPPIYQSVYSLCELEERSVSETAHQLGISVAATKSRLLRARQIVRIHLDQSVCAP